MPLEDGPALVCEQGSATKVTMGSKGRTDEKACFAEAIASSRLRCKERLVACVKALPEVVNQQDGEGVPPSTKQDPSYSHTPMGQSSAKEMKLLIFNKERLKAEILEVPDLQ